MVLRLEDAISMIMREGGMEIERKEDSKEERWDEGQTEGKEKQFSEQNVTMCKNTQAAMSILF